MQQGVKILAACGVLAGGIMLAMLFRHQPGSPPAAGPEDGERLALRRRVDAPRPRRNQNPPIERAPQPAAPQPTLTPAPPPESASPNPRVLTPLAGSRMPPDLAKEYPSVPWGQANDPWSRAESGEGSAGALHSRTHKIMDGDTLPRLAERYLGSPDRAGELYEANRDVLPDPAILPLGTELKIPPTSPAASPSNYMPKRPLVPVVPDGSGR